MDAGNSKIARQLKSKQMFTLEQIEQAQQEVKSGAYFPKYIREIKELGLLGFETSMINMYTEYLKAHQQGKMDYNTL